MIKVEQKLYGPGIIGDCLPACIASILELPLEEVPHFVQLYDDDTWWAKLQEWLMERGLFAIEIPYSIGHCPVPEGTLCIVSGRTAFSDNTLHSCVAIFGTVTEDGQPINVIHDPHPLGKEKPSLINIREILFFGKKI